MPSILDRITQHKIKKNGAAFIDRIIRHEWNHIRNILNSPRQCIILRRFINECNTLTLHIALSRGYLAPLDIIQSLYQITPAAAFDFDNNGANALIIACLTGASYDCIDYILSETATEVSRPGENLATKLDHDGRCALHYAVEFACVNREDDVYTCDLSTSTDGEQQSYLRVIQRVLWAAPDMLNAQDKYGGDTPIDFVQDLKAKTNSASAEHQRLDEICKILRRASIEYYMRKKSEWEEDGYQNKIKTKSKSKSKKDIKRQGGAYHQHKLINISERTRRGTSSTSKSESLTYDSWWTQSLVLTKHDEEGTMSDQIN